MDPFLTLGVSEKASDEEVRAAYLLGIQTYTPERNPERFQQIVTAYEKLRDEDARIEFLLSNTEMPAETPLQAAIQAIPLDKPLSFAEFQSFLRNSARK